MMAKMSARISRRNLPAFNHQPKRDHAPLANKHDLSSKAVADAHRNMEILKERGMDLGKILSHDLKLGRNLGWLEIRIALWLCKGYITIQI